MRVFLLMAGLTALLVVFGQAAYGPNGALMFFLFAAVMNLIMYWFSDRFVLRMYRRK
jgi:heat shock protein HtpX